jgi:hypothetical protein
MKGYMGAFGSLAVLAGMGFQGSIAHSQGVQVHMVITNEAVKDGDDTPDLKPGNVEVTQGKAVLKLTQVIPAQADNAALQLFILIDDTCDSQYRK